MKLLFCLVTLFFVFHVIYCNTITINTSLGKVIGIHEDSISKFKSIPYAQTTAGTNRWQPPIPIQAWSDAYNATEYIAACAQPYYPPDSDPFLNVPRSEDCLQLNIFTPLDFTSPVTSEFPVMVYIHGGSFYSGWGGDPIFHGDYIVNQTMNTVLVTINYRLGALGFLVTEEIGGNFGFMDQQLALKWVQDNIGDYGGDPNKVTIFGQSAGGMSVTLHLLSPSSFGLYQRALIESNPAGINYRNQEESYAYGENLANNLGCNVTDINCLQSKTWEEIIDAQDEGVRPLYFPFNTTEVMQFYPTIDGNLIPEQPIQMLLNGDINPNVEAVTIGTNRNDSMTFIPNGYISPIEYEALVFSFFGINATKVLHHYPPVEGDNSNNLSIAATDWLFVCPTRVAARGFASITDTYAYQFFHVPSDDPMNPNHLACAKAVCHSDELIYVFHSSEFVNATYTPDEVELSFEMLHYWTNFAHNITDPPYPNLPSWPKYNQNTSKSMRFDFEITVTSNYDDEKCNFWDSMGYYN